MIKVKKEKRGRPSRHKAGIDLRSLGERIRRLRGPTPQAEFARVLGVSQAQLSKYELGQSAPPLRALAKLAEISTKSVDWLLTGKN
jgi:transcriptional regulator with XRE-family HTH domain